MTTQSFVIATHNPAKQREIGQILEFYGARGIAYDQLTTRQEFPAEGKRSYEENATKKAQFISRLLPDQNVIADDSGLELKAFPQKFGIETARQLTPHFATKSDMNDGIIQLVNGHDRHFVMKTVIALARNGQVVQIAHGELSGTIATAQHGNEGLGFDRILIPNGLDHTLAEMDFASWVAYCHRSRAVKNLLDLMEETSK